LRLARPAARSLVWGGMLGAAQALALRRVGLARLRWLLATALGAAAGAALAVWWSGSQPVSDAPRELHEILLAVLRFSLLQGLGIGIAQAIAVRGLASARIAWAAVLAVAFVLAEGPAFFTRALVPLIPTAEASGLTLWYSLHSLLASAGRGLAMALLTLPWLGEQEGPGQD